MSARTRNFLLLGAGLIAAVVLFVLLRPGDDADEVSPPPPPPTAPTTTTTSTTTRPRPPERITIPIVVRGGVPVGGIRRASVKRNRRVVLIVRSDVADHVHMHGYDIFRDLAPGKPARLAFRATLPGRFEAELEDRSVQLLDLQVRP